MTAPAKHTPGPWHLEPHRNGNDALISGPKGEWLEFARVVVRMEGCYTDAPDGIANANLIAAAPQLADALEALLTDHAAQCECPLVEQARAALRAAGRQP